jgi:hypothetical protein
MSQEQTEVPPSADALLDGYEGTCKACAAEADTGKTIEAGHTCPEPEPVRLGEGHLPTKLERQESMTVGQKLESWALAGQPGAPQGVPCAPPGTILAR